MKITKRKMPAVLPPPGLSPEREGEWLPFHSCLRHFRGSFGSFLPANELAGYCQLSASWRTEIPKTAEQQSGKSQISIRQISNLKSQFAKSQISNLNSPNLKSQISNLKSQITKSIPSG
jgi:hypothetical protein